ASQERLRRLQASYAFRYPRRLYEQKEQQLDVLLDRLARQRERLLDKKRQQWRELRLRLWRHHPAAELERTKERQKAAAGALEKAMRTALERHALRFRSHVARLEALSPLRIMERGYSLVYNERRELVKRIGQLQVGERLSIRIQDGQVDCQVTGVEEKTI
ncbi:exodeoxyribonuclease VII large subunit, partial [Geobacillus stearothermophilus]